MINRDYSLLQRLVHKEALAEEDKAVLRRLLRKEVLEKTQSGDRFQVPLVQQFVERVVLEQV